MPVATKFVETRCCKISFDGNSFAKVAKIDKMYHRRLRKKPKTNLFEIFHSVNPKKTNYQHNPIFIRPLHAPMFAVDDRVGGGD